MNVLVCAEQADAEGNLYTGPNTEDTPVIVESADFHDGIVIVQVNEIVDKLPRVDIPASWIDVMVEADRPDHPAVTRTLDEVSEYLNTDIRELDSEKALRSSVSVQLALLACVSRWLRCSPKTCRPEAVAGLSVGAFGAAVLCGVISLPDAVRLVRQRADIMVHLYPTGYGLAAIVGLNEEQVSRLVEETYTEKVPVYVGNINAPSQIVIAGSDEGIRKVLEAARKNGARNAEELHVSVPSHCPLLEPVAAALRELKEDALAIAQLCLCVQRERKDAKNVGCDCGGLSEQRCARRSLVRFGNSLGRVGLPALS